MLERDRFHFFDCSGLKETEGIDRRATAAYIQEALEKRFHGEYFSDIRVSRNDSGVYKPKRSLLDAVFGFMFGTGLPTEGLPPYIEVDLFHQTGLAREHLTVWSPVAWNGRFAGTAGGGTSCGGRSYLTKPNNTQRGWTVPMAVINGFTAATVDAMNCKGIQDFMLDEKTGSINKDLYENWRVRSTHNMTVFGKAIAEILHERPVEYAYMNGGSGGGRQCLMEVQNYPEDYDGVWASCPAINWIKFLLGGYWAEVVMNERGYILTAEKNLFLTNAVHEAAGGEYAYYHKREVQDFDYRTCIGQKTKGGVITAKDATVMKETMQGPVRRDGSFMWYGFRNGVKNWQKVIPIGTYYYPLIGRRPKPFALGPICLRWVTGDPKGNYDGMKRAEFESYFDRAVQLLSDSLGDDANLDAFVKRGGKLMIDHGIDDPLIPVDGTLDYYRKILSRYGAEKTDTFLRMYVAPGDNHGNCQGNGPGITEKDGILALMDWVEKGVAPESLRKVRVDRKTGQTLEEGMEPPYREK